MVMCSVEVSTSHFYRRSLCSIFVMSLKIRSFWRRRVMTHSLVQRWLVLNFGVHVLLTNFHQILRMTTCTISASKVSDILSCDNVLLSCRRESPSICCGPRRTILQGARTHIRPNQFPCEHEACGQDGRRCFFVSRWAQAKSDASCDPWLDVICSLYSLFLCR